MEVMDVTTVCRTCVTGKCLDPIFSELSDPELYSETLLIVTGVKVQLNDGLPQNMCTKCIAFIKESLAFRKQCKEAELQLLQHKNLYLKCQILKNEDELNMENEEEIPLKYLLNEDINIKNEEIDISEDKMKMKEEIKEANCLTDIVLDDSNDFLIVHSNSNRVTCKLCQKNLSKRSVDMHIAKKHPGADGRKVKCDCCNKIFLKRNLDRHKNSTHAKGSFKCANCKTDFHNKESLIEHSRICTSMKRLRKPSKSGRQMAECDVCNKVMLLASLKMHQKIKHAGMGPVCDHCGHRFSNKHRLKDHLRAKHGYEKFKCSMCDFQSASSVAMANHERRHRGEKPFICESCGAKFHASYLLRQHRQSHRIDRPMKCAQCPATFKTNNSLHMHRASVHGASRHPCSQCTRAYSCRHYAARHRRLVHARTDALDTS